MNAHQTSNNKAEDSVKENGIPLSTVPPATNNEVPVAVDIEEGIELSGSCGRYQVFLQFLYTYLVLCIGCTAFLPYFILDDPAWMCTVNNNTTNTTRNEFCRNHPNEHIKPSSEYYMKRCNMNASEWSYTKEKDYSIVTEFDLVCDKATYAAIGNSVFFIGAIISAILSGKLADTYGRKIVIIGLMSVIVISGMTCSFITSVWQFVTLRGLYGLGMPLFNIGVVYLMEFVPAKRRALSGLLYQTPYSISCLILDGVASLDPRWRRIQRYVILPIFVAFIPIALQPESPRWLLATGKMKKAEHVLRTVASRNGKQFESSLETPSSSGTDGDKTYSYLDLFRQKKVIITTVAQAFLWLTSAMLYYAIGLESSKIGGDMYQVFAFSVLIELPGSLMSLYLCNRFGRKKCVLGTLFLCGLFTAAIGVIPRSYSAHHSSLNITFALLAKFSVNVTYCSIFVWSFEINPTVIRSQALLLFNVFEHSGGIVAPFIVGVLQNLNFILSFFVMSAMAIGTATFALTLPETNNMPSREQYEDYFDRPHNTTSVRTGTDNEMCQT